MLVLPQRKAQPVDRLIVGVILGTPDLQRMGIGVLIVIPQEEGVFRHGMAAPDHEIGHDRRVGAGGIGQTSGDTLAKNRVGTASRLIGRAGRGALPDDRASHADSQQSIQHGAALRPPCLAARPAQQCDQHSQRHQADAVAFDRLGDVAVPPVHLTGLLVFGRKPDQQRRGGEHGKAGKEQQKVLLFVRQRIQCGQCSHGGPRDHNAAEDIRRMDAARADAARQHRVEREARRHLHQPCAQQRGNVKVRRYAVNTLHITRKDACGPQRVGKPRPHVEGQRHALA